MTGVELLPIVALGLGDLVADQIAVVIEIEASEDRFIVKAGAIAVVSAKRRASTSTVRQR